ncbi:MAG: 16S rRNA (adenine(1518)-N(6)/adenine(1519)-N(6))-dimethyltransferase RsmA [Clostridiaceae bacterium]|nr:16S rRNA (adenine(1518)-N(6)/adenine(1519)-N(6))-dimethyltransferase RsmA [Clostridiaceae bacterium]
MDKMTVQALCARFQIKPSHTLGQNFLTDSRVIEQIIKAADISKDDLVLEIGPGLGALTHDLARQAGRVIAIELDRSLIIPLQDILAEFTDTCQVIQGDALQADFAALTVEWPEKIKVIANLPYYITTPLIEKVLRELPGSHQLIFMLQKEAVERLLASPGTKSYSPLAILAASFGQAKKIADVPAASFYPQPHVDSCVVSLDATGQLPIVNWSEYNRFLNACFGQRRKTLANSLRIAGYPANSLQKLPGILRTIGAPDDVRAEKLDKNQFFNLFQQIKQQQK